MSNDRQDCNGDAALILRAVLEELGQNEWDSRHAPGGFDGPPSTDMFMYGVKRRVPSRLHAAIDQAIVAFVAESAANGRVPYSLLTPGCHSGSQADASTPADVARTVAMAIYREIRDDLDSRAPDEVALPTDPAVLVLNASARLPPALAQSILTSRELRSRVRAPHQLIAESHCVTKPET